MVGDIWFVRKSEMNKAKNTFNFFQYIEMEIYYPIILKVHFNPCLELNSTHHYF